MPHKKYIHQPTVIKDLAVLIGVNLVFLFLFIQVDLLEWVYHFSRQHETLELDELIPLGLTAAVSLLVFSYRRIKELGKMAQTLEQMSLLDPLTGLANRRAGQISLISWCELAEKNQQDFVIYQINIDEFSRVNQLYGQQVGDEVIIRLARRLKSELPKKAQLFRWLDDNFIIVIPLNNVGSPHQFCYTLQESINNKVMPSTLSLSCSVGYSIWQKGQTPDDILHDAEEALINTRQAKTPPVKAYN